MSKASAELVALVERTVDGLGYELVDVERAGPLLRVTLDVRSAPGEVPRSVSIEDCERVSHQLTHLFAVEGVAYDRLEVSSPGVDRPLRRARDFERFVGSAVKVQLFAPIEGRKRMQGRLLGVSGAVGAERIQVEIENDEPARPHRAGAGRVKQVQKKVKVPGKVVEFALADVDKARLVPELNFRSQR